MGLQMADVGVLNILFVFVGLMDQQIEPTCVRVSVHDCKKLLFVQLDQRLNRLTECIQKALGSFAIRDRITQFLAHLIFFCVIQLPVAFRGLSSNSDTNLNSTEKRSPGR
jgi:hypothetical protein